MAYDVDFGNCTPKHSSPYADPSRPSITKVYFRGPMSEHQRSTVHKAWGINCDSGLVCSNSYCRQKGPEAKLGREKERRRNEEIKQRKCLSGNPIHGWKMQSDFGDGTEFEVSFWIHLWKTAEKEDEGKSKVDLAPFRQTREGQTYFDVWTERLQYAGAVEFLEEHWHPLCIHAPVGGYALVD